MTIIAGRRDVWLVAFLAFAGGAVGEPAATDLWPGLVTDIFQNRSIATDATVTLETPSRAEDAAIVPMTLRFAEPDKVKAATLVIDQNPMPMAAAFTFGDKAGVGFIETRARVNSYSNVHAVAETRDGKLHSEMKFVKAAGGCSAPAGKNLEEAAANIGKMKYREFNSADASKREAQIMVRHPNLSGMQMDQLSRNYIPAHYIDRLEVRQGDALIFSMEGGISLSEDPVFRFNYAPNGSKTIRALAHDIKGNEFRAEWPIGENF